MEKQRNFSLDLYRLLCMYLITCIHIFGYSNMVELLHHTNPNYYLLNFVETLEAFAINGFVLISAYFLVKSSWSINKVIGFYINFLFYSIILLGLGFLVFNSFSAGLVVKSFFPVLTNHYWYPINYIVLLMLIPFLNKAIASLTQKQFLYTILVLAFLSSLYFHLNPLFNPEIFIGHPSRSILWFITLYFIAGYIRLFGVKRKMLMGPVLLILSVLIMFLMKSFNVIHLLKSYFPFLSGVLDKIAIFDNNSILSLLITVSSFITFSNISINLPTKIGKLATAYITPALFGVYLIQEHSSIRASLWDAVNISQWSNSLWLLPSSILIFIGLLLVAILLNLLYQLAYKLILSKVIDSISKKLNTLSLFNAWK